MLRRELRTGIDIGSSSAKLVQVRMDGEIPVFSRMAILELAGDPAGSRTSAEQALADLVRVEALNGTTVISAITDASVRVRAVWMPRMPDSEMAAGVRWEAEKFTPFPVQRAVVDYEVLERGAGRDERAVLIVAVLKEAVERHLALIRGAGLRPSTVNVAPMALLRCFQANHAGVEGEVAALVHIGGKSTQVVIVSGGVLQLTRSFPLGGESFTGAIGVELGLSADAAEQRKREVPWGGDDLEEKMLFYSAIEPLLGGLTREIDLFFKHYEETHPLERIERIVLSGGSAGLANGDGYLSDRLGVPVEVADPFRSVRGMSPDTAEAVRPVAPGFAVALGSIV